MKKYILALSVAFFVIACNKKEEKQQVQPTKQELSFGQFEEAPVVDDIGKVPFIVYPKVPALKLYLHPDEKAPFLERNIEKTETLFGESEVSNFYKIIYQVEGNPQNSKFAYVLKSDVDRDNELLLSEKDDLYSVRYLNVNGRTIDGIKSFKDYGNVSLTDKTTYNTVFKNNPQTFLSNGNKPETTESSYTFRLRDGSLKELPKTVTGEDNYELQYLGFSKDLDRQFFDVLEHGIKTHITSFSTINSELDEISFNGFPAFFKSKNLIASIGNDEAGCLLAIQQYNPQNYSMKELYTVNFTGFEISDSKSLLWDQNGNLYLEIHHPNTNTTRNYKKQYLSISFRDL